MHNCLAECHGEHWYDRIDLDKRSYKAFDKASNQVLRGHQDLAANDPSIPGRLIAQCTLGTWVGLLDQGGWTGDGSTRRRVDYEELWRDTLHKAFPGGRTVARLHGERFTRSYTHRIAKNVQH